MRRHHPSAHESWDIDRCSNCWSPAKALSIRTWVGSEEGIDGQIAGRDAMPESLRKFNDKIMSFRITGQAARTVSLQFCTGMIRSDLHSTGLQELLDPSIEQLPPRRRALHHASVCIKDKMHMNSYESRMTPFPWHRKKPKHLHLSNRRLSGAWKDSPFTLFEIEHELHWQSTPFRGIAGLTLHLFMKHMTHYTVTVDAFPGPGRTWMRVTTVHRWHFPENVIMCMGLPSIHRWRLDIEWCAFCHRMICIGP